MYSSERSVAKYKIYIDGVKDGIQEVHEHCGNLKTACQNSWYYIDT